MIMNIAKHQFLNNIYTFRFLVSFLLCELLFAGSAVILSGDYTERMQQYNTDVSNHAEAKKQIYTFARLNAGLNRPPEKLSIICLGSDRNMGTTVNVAFDQAPTISEGSGARNPLLVIFPQLDLMTIVQIILSLLVILFSYNAVSGARENGTLRLMMSNSIPRYAVLLGNIIGGLASILLPLFVGMLTALVLFLFNPFVSLGFSDIMLLLFISLIAAAYLSMYYMLGVFLSSRIRRSSTVLIVMLLVWVLFVIVVPNISVYAGKMIVDVPDKTEVDTRAQAINSEWQREMFTYLETHPRPEHNWNFIRGRAVMQGDLPYAYMLWYAPQEVAQWLLDGSIYGHNLKMEYEDRVFQLYRDFGNRLQNQANAAKMFSRISPSWVFYNAVATLSGTNEQSYLSFLNQAQEYRSELISYMQDKGGLSTYRLFSSRPIEEFLTLAELIELKNTRGEHAVADLFGRGWSGAEPLEINDMPQFEYSEIPVTRRITAALPELGIIFFFNILFFSLAWVAFQKADVR